MTKLTLLGAAAVLSTVLAGPAMAQHAVVHPDTYARGFCAGHEPGNPYTKEETTSPGAAGAPGADGTTAMTGIVCAAAASTIAHRDSRLPAAGANRWPRRLRPDPVLMLYTRGRGRPLVSPGLRGCP